MILHISNAFLGSKVHKNLYSTLDKLGINQAVYTVIRGYKKPKKENLIQFNCLESKIVIAKTVLKTHHRILFHKKINALYNDLCIQLDISTIDTVSATTLFTDGAIAYKIFKEFKKPYIITVRNTDVNYFLKLRPDLLLLAKDILLCARRITFLSPGLKENFLNHWFIHSFKDRIEDKIAIIYNGIEDFWIENKYIAKHKLNGLYQASKVLFVGRISKEKNLSRLIRVISRLQGKYPNLSLSLVGPWGDAEREVRGLIEKHKHCVEYIGEIKDQEKLLEIYREHDIFAMPSTKESFGLVYLEALTQGLPVLYTKGQGFDGVLKESVGESVYATNIHDIERGLETIVCNYTNYFPIEVDFDQFRWENIADKYRELYDLV